MKLTSSNEPHFRPTTILSHRPKFFHLSTHPRSTGIPSDRGQIIVTSGPKKHLIKRGKEKGKQIRFFSLCKLATFNSHLDLLALRGAAPSRSRALQAQYPHVRRKEEESQCTVSSVKIGDWSIPSIIKYILSHTICCTMSSSVS